MKNDSFEENIGYIRGAFSAATAGGRRYYFLLCVGMLLFGCARAHNFHLVDSIAAFGFVNSTTRLHRRLDLVSLLSSFSSSPSPGESSEVQKTRMETGSVDPTIIRADGATLLSPTWNNDPQLLLQQHPTKRKRNNNTRFRQHVNPLARRFQQPAILPDKWPRDVFVDCTKGLHVDIGCGKGGFLLDLVTDARAKSSNGILPCNYLGLEIRPGVAQYAKERIAIHKVAGILEYLGCNANVDLKRVLQRYHDAAVTDGGSTAVTGATDDESKLLKFVSIQYPDPHFKSQHAKRRVVTSSLIDTLARYMPPNGQVFLQSDVKSVLDDMRLRFRESDRYFQDTIESESEYLDNNPLQVPTEREISVLKRGLPVFRSMIRRNNVPYGATVEG